MQRKDNLSWTIISNKLLIRFFQQDIDTSCIQLSTKLIYSKITSILKCYYRKNKESGLRIFTKN